eukprot:6083573-Pleurochrysis_carterae.AAC.1
MDSATRSACTTVLSSTSESPYWIQIHRLGMLRVLYTVLRLNTCAWAYFIGLTDASATDEVVLGHSQISNYVTAAYIRAVPKMTTQSF